MFTAVMIYAGLEWLGNTVKFASKLAKGNTEEKDTFDILGFALVQGGLLTLFVLSWMKLYEALN